MSVRAPLLAALVVGTSLAVAPAPAAVAAPAHPAVLPAVPVAAPAADAATPEVTSVPVGPEPDGTAVRLDVSVWPQASGTHPVVLLAHGFGGTKDSMATQAAELHDRGYVVITWSARGHGRSGGRIHLNDPAYEIADARALLDLAAKRSDVELDAAGDPRAGVMGASYGGALGLMLAGADRRVDGVVSAITWNDLADAFFPQAAVTAPPTTAAGRAPVATPGPFKQVWATNFFLSALRGGERGRWRRRGPLRPLRPDDLPALRAGLGDGSPSAELTTLLRAHSPKPTMNAVTAPTFLVQGVGDSLFGLDQADANASALAANDVPYAVRWSDGGHDAPSTHEAEELDASYAWLDHFVRDKGPAGSGGSALPTAAFTYGTPATRPGQPTTLHTLPAYPGLSGATLQTRSLPLGVTSGSLVHPPGGQPASLIAVPGLAALGISLSTYQIAALPGQSAALDTQPIGEAATVVGSPTLRLTVTSDTQDATLFASVWRVTGGSVTLTNPLVAPVRVAVTPGRPTPVTISLPGAVYDLPAGTRWRVLLTSTESTYSNSRVPSGIRISDASALTLPVAVGTAVSGGAVARGLDVETLLAAGALGCCSSQRSSAPSCAAGVAGTCRRGPTSPTFPSSSRASSRRMPTGTGPSTTSPGGPRRARSSGCSAPTAPARRRRCAWSWASSPPTRAPCTCWASRCRPGRRCSRGSAPSSRDRASCRTSPAARTSRPTGPQRAARPRTPTSTRRSTSRRWAAPSTARSSPTARACASGSASRRRCSGCPSCSSSTSRRTARPAADRGHAPDPAPLRRDRPHRRRVEPPARRGRDDVHPRRFVMHAGRVITAGPSPSSSTATT